TRPSHVSTDTSGLRKNLAAESLTRAQCRSRSGVVPSNARAPSNTQLPSQAACVRGPMIGTLPSCHSPSKKVHVFDSVLCPLIETSFVLLSPAINSPLRDALCFFLAAGRRICHHPADAIRPRATSCPPPPASSTPTVPCSTSTQRSAATVPRRAATPTGFPTSGAPNSSNTPGP